jgi:membrane peptidoglycan carboxypeptidase
VRRLPSRKLTIVVSVLVVLIAAGAIVYARLPDPTTLFQPPERPSIIITDRSGRVLYEAIDSQGNKHVPLPLAAIPPACSAATIATEDANFYRHPGVDPVAIARAVWLNLRAGETVSGGSTLTQQLARNLLMTEAERSERTLGRKLREAWLAWRLERKVSKDELLALYLNTTYYGHYATGIEAAAQAYFGVHAGELDLAQCAMLAGLPQWPARYNPIENLDAARQRQATVLRLMVEQAVISAEQAKEAGEEDLRFASTPFPIQAPHFVMYVQGLLETLLPAERVAQGGLRVVTTLDMDWQAAGEAAVSRRIEQLRPCAVVEGALPGVSCDPNADPTRRVENAALVALDPQTGAIRTMVGSPDYFDVSRSGAVNAALAQRQPGSAIKPLTYALALDPAAARKAGRAVMTPASLIPDIRTSFPTAEGDPYVPNNYDRRYHGPVTVRTALANSYNIPAVRTLQAVGVDNLVDFARSLGIPWQRSSQPANVGDEGRKGEKSRYGLSLTLGGGEVRLVDLAGAYGALANGGYRVEPYAIERIETLDGEPLWTHDEGFAGQETARKPARQVLDARVAFLLTDILSDDLARWPAFGEGSSLDIGRPAAAKTGTTTDWRDNWTMGYTPELVAGVWVGNADNTPMKDVSGITGAGPIWHDFMTAVSRGRPAAPFAVPAGLVEQEVCADSGLLPAEASARVEANGVQVVPCPARRVEWFIEGTEPHEIDREHMAVMVDNRTGEQVTGSSPDAHPEAIWQLAPEYQAWARDSGIPQLAASSPAASGQLASLSGKDDVPLRLVSPDPGRSLRIDPGLPPSAQQLPVTALPGFAAARVTLTVDGVPFAQVEAPEYTAWWLLQEGRHVFGAWAARDDGSRVESPEVVVVVEK